MKNFHSYDDILKLLRETQSEEHLKFQIRFLSHLVIDLLREVEALRTTKIEESKKEGISPKDSIYGQHYRKICLSTHSSLGARGGHYNFIVNDWLPNESESSIPLSELSMLKRLEYTSEEMKEYLQKVLELETLT